MAGPDRYNAPPALMREIRDLRRRIKALEGGSASVPSFSSVPIWNIDVPATATGAVQDLWYSEPQITNQILRVQVQAKVSGGATAGVLVRVDDGSGGVTFLNADSGEQTLTSASYITLTFEVDVTSQIGQVRGVHVRGRIVSGTGTLSVAMRSAYFQYRESGVDPNI